MGNTRTIKAPASAPVGTPDDFFQRAYGMGLTFAQHAAEAEDQIRALLADVSGRSDQSSVDRFKAARDGWKEGYAAGRLFPENPGKNASAAERDAYAAARNTVDKAWSRLVNTLAHEGWTPPATPEMRKAAARAQLARDAAKRGTSNPAPQKTTKPAGPVAPVSGAEAARNALEVHMLSLYRQGKIRELHAFIDETVAKS